jgi:archaellum component FlaC
MTDEQQKTLAELVLVQSERISVLSGMVANLIERMADSGEDFEGRANSLRSDAEQSDAGNADVAKEIERLRKYFGLA